MLVPANIATPDTADDDRRLGHWLINQSQPGGARVALIGFPSDEGVKRNGGRPGAAQAPDAIRTLLYRLTPDARQYANWCSLLEQTTDLGNVAITGDVAADQALLGSVLAPLIRQGIVPVVLGGGHETAFGHFLGYAGAKQPVHILNIDAHADVRPLRDGQPHSGSPFYQALLHESGSCAHYAVLGLSPTSVAHAHVAFMETHNCACYWRDEMNLAFVQEYFAGLEHPTLLTLDMDVVRQAEAPGVSAPAADGIPLKLLYNIAYLAGKSTNITSLDLVEVNPQVDNDFRTIRAAAVTLWYFLCGVAERQV